MVLRIISLPGKSHENRYFKYFLSSLEDRGVVVLHSSMRNFASMRYDILHVHFPTHYITEYRLIAAIFLSLLFSIYLIVVRLSGRRIVYTAHDVAPLRIRHKTLLRCLSRFFISVAHAFIFLSKSSRVFFEEIYPHEASKPWILVPHGPYLTTTMTGEDRIERRKAITGDVPTFIVGFLGAIKPYKNIDALLDLPQQTEGGLPVHIVVAGQIERGYEDATNAVIGRLSNQVTWVDRRLSDSDLDRWIQTVDLVVLPYVRGSNSGSALLVLSNNCRFAGSELPVFQEILEEVGESWVYCLHKSIANRKTLQQLINRAASSSLSEGDYVDLHKYLDKISWSEGAILTEKFYKEVCPCLPEVTL